MEMLNGIIQFFQAGGVFMYPILALLALGTAIIIERFFYLLKASVREEALWQQVQKLMNGGRLQEAVKVCGKTKAPLGDVLTRGLERIQEPWTPEDLQSSLEEVLLERIPLLERRTHYLPTLANVSTLLGLLGTIIGLIASFSAIAAVDPSQKAALLAEGLSVAMSTTAFGLLVAIPILICFTWLSTKTNRIVEGLEEITTKFMNHAKRLGGFQKEGGTRAVKAAK